MVTVRVKVFAGIVLVVMTCINTAPWTDYSHQRQTYLVLVNKVTLTPRNWRLLGRRLHRRQLSFPGREYLRYSCRKNGFQVGLAATSLAATENLRLL